MNVLILTNGDYGDYAFCHSLKTYDYILCADNGMKHAKVLGICPDEILGDFDSCSQEDLEFFRQKDVRVTQAPCEKDETDTELALDTAIAMGATYIDLWGGIGSRLDHSLANIHLLYKALMQGVQVTVYSHQHQLQLMQDDIWLHGRPGDLV
ncbi:MAG: thiamine diphosphokinase, partial [Niameybacter sp.]